ncbi:MAG: sugar phosphate isomerase/epimerase, partial [Alphaproteobacteria bacterium]|nr:sugar phosphate isomerase/epimerase [Alphaproteobacteria bacterium]
MKISCLPVSLFEDFLIGKRTLIDWIQTGSKIGLNGIDISTIMVKNHTPLYINQIKSNLKKYKIPIIMYSTYPDFTNPEKLQRDRELEYLRSDIALASSLKAKYIRLVAGQAHPGVSVRKGIKWVLENFKIAEETSNKYKISLVFENHSKPSVWKFADFSHPTEIFLEIVEKLKDTSI